MLKRILESLGQSFYFLRTDPKIILYSLIPVLIGGGIFFFLGNWIYGDFLSLGREYIKSSITISGWGDTLYYLFVSVITVAFFFLINWTFVLIVSLIASPFNDLISARIERKILGQKSLSASEDMNKFLGRFFFVIVNEIKKVTTIVFLTIVSFLFSFIPFVGPLITMFLTGLLLSIEFLDYSWSRHDLKLSTCLRDLKSSPLQYSISGMGFMFLLSIPILNILILPLSVIFYTSLYCEKLKKMELP